MLAAMASDPPQSSNKFLILVVCILGSVIVFLDQTVVTVALPAIQSELNADLTGQLWVVEAYLVTLGSLLLIGGALGDVVGRKRVFVWGLVAFGTTSVLCAAAPTTEFLVAGRALQGVAGAFLVPAALALITATFFGRERGRAVGLWTAWTGIAFVIGPLVGGALIDLISWRMICAINVPLVALNLWLIRICVREINPGDSLEEIDFGGAALSAVGLTGIVFGLVHQQSVGFGDPLVLFSLLLGAGSLLWFIIHELLTAHPMLPLEVFKIRNFAVGNLATFAVYGALGAGTFFVTIFLQQIADYSAFAAGLALTPITLILFVLSSRFGKLTYTIGPRMLMGIGPIVAGVGLILIGRIGSEVDYLPDLLPGVLLLGLGLAITVAPLTTTVLSSLPENQAGLASGANNAVARVASLLAIAIVGTVVAFSYKQSLDDQAAALNLNAAQQVELEQAKDHPLEAVDDVDSQQVATAAREASVDAYRIALLVAAVVSISGGAISLIGITNRGMVKEASSGAS